MMNLLLPQLSASSLQQSGKVDLFNPVAKNNDCQIEASNDVEAVKIWLSLYNKNTTFNTYKKEAERFLLWCTYERGLHLNQLKVQDFESYIQFLQNPPLTWIADNRPGKKGRKEGDWRPFLGPLNKTSLIAAIRIINSLMKFLVSADYLKRNPLQLIKRVKDFKQVMHERRYKIKERMLEKDEWQAVQQTINELPEDTDANIDCKLKIQFLFALLYLLGLRIHEVAKHTWGDFKQFNGHWCFLVLGKGDKLREIQVNDQLLSIIKTYRLHLNKMPLPSNNDTEHLLVSRKTRKPLKVRQLFQLVKNIGRLAAAKFPNNAEKFKKLQQLSPHWLRHLLASHLDEIGSSGSTIQSILRHESFSTTQNYMHSEEKRKYNEMQKIRIDIEPRLVIRKPEKTRTELKINLKGGPLSETNGLKCFLLMLDDYIFCDLNWRREETLEALVQRYQKVMIFKESIEITYIIENKLEKEVTDSLNKAIKREAQIRLFECYVQLLERVG